MENIKVGCIPVRQAINVNTKFFRIKKFLKDNKVGLIIAGIATVLFSTYIVLIINFINLIKIMH